MLTKDRIGAGLAIVAAVVGLVLVFTSHGSEAKSADDDDRPATPPTSQVQQAPPAGVAPSLPAGVTPPGGPAPSVAPSPPAQQAPPPKDNDGDDDDN